MTKLHRWMLVLTLLFVLPGYGQEKPQPPEEKPAKSPAGKVARPKAGQPGKDNVAKKQAAKPRPEKLSPSWIWLAANPKPAAKVFFRKEFEVKGSVSTARLYATCDSCMTIYLDGQEIARHDDVAKPIFRDVTRLFDPPAADGKKHVLAIAAENRGDDKPAGLLVRLDLDSGWRAAWSEVSDAAWLATAAEQDGWQQTDFVAVGWKPAAVIAALGGEPWPQITAAVLAAAAPLHPPTATPIEAMKIAKDFRVELLYSVPKEIEGSWVSLCADPKGRLIVSDQYGGLFRITPPPIGAAASEKIGIEKIDVDIGEAQGLLWAFDSLYVVVNKGEKYESGLYRVRDSDGDDRLDKLETLRLLDGGAEHGPHAILPAPDGKSLYVLCGNKTKLTEIDASRVPRVWDEDLMLPRLYGRGFMKETPAPGGFICRIDPDGKHWELIATGFRNQYDAAFNADGELFTYDSDMEWDVNTPWYRPTRVCQVVSGAEFGWRNGSGKWPPHYPDSVPPVLEVGPGSPTGVSFGYGAKFPQKYQRALFLCDWSYGKLYAAHLIPHGASYRGELEEFITGTPLPLTDVIIHPLDGAMYFSIGGRRVQSGLYRVTYAGPESTAATETRQIGGVDDRAGRRLIEELHSQKHSDAIERAWQGLGHADRFIRYAARIALEHQPVAEWQKRALAETDPQASLTALLALVRLQTRPTKGQVELDTLPPAWDEIERRQQTPDRELVLAQVLASLERLDWEKLTDSQRIELLRVYSVALLRLGPPSEKARQKLIAVFEPRLPAEAREVNSELAQILVYLQAPSAAAKIVRLLGEAPTQEDQIDLAKTLRHLRDGWTPELRESYFRWFSKAGGFRGGASFAMFVQELKQDALAKLTDEQRLALKPILDLEPTGDGTPVAAAPRPFVRAWTFDELAPLVERGLHSRDFDRGRKMFAAALCFGCHRFDGQGGVLGPDLTSLAGRFSPRDILESVVSPNKVISDQYAAVTITTSDGRVYNGRIVNLAGDSMRLNTNMLDPNAEVAIDRRQIDEMFPSKTSMMPSGLLNSLSESELLDLMAYLLSRGDRRSPLFLPKAGP